MVKDKARYCLVGGAIGAAIPLILLILCFLPFVKFYAFAALFFVSFPLFLLYSVFPDQHVFTGLGYIEIVDALGIIYISDVLILAVVYFLLGYCAGWLIWKS